MQKLNYQNGMNYPPPQTLFKKQSSNIPMVKDHTAPHPMMDIDKETKKMEQAPSTTTKVTTPSAATT